MLEFLSKYLNAYTISITISLSFLYFLWQATKMYRIYLMVDKVIKKDDILAALAATKLAPLRDAYVRTMTPGTDDNKKTNIPASEIFSDFNSCKMLKLNLRSLDAASGMLVGLGLLGTFWGLTIGINDFDSSNSENIQKSIQLLLNGMSTAFVTSLVGMFTSLLYIPSEKSLRTKMSRHLHLLTEKLDELYYIDDVTLTLQNQEKMFNNLYLNLKGMVTTQSQNIMEQVKSDTLMLQEKLTYKNEEDQTVSIGNAIREILSENTEQTRALKSFSTDVADNLVNLSDALNENFEHKLSRPIQEKFMALIENFDLRTNMIIQHIDDMAAQMASPATDMIQNVVEELKSSMLNMVSEFKQNISGSATSELENLAAQLGTATAAMAEFPNNMANISSTLQVTIEEVKRTVAEISNSSANANSAAMEKMQEQITLATGAVSSAINEVKDVMGRMSQSSEKQSSDMAKKMAEAAEKMSTFMDGTVSNLSSSVQESMQNITDRINNIVDEISTTSTHTNEAAMKQMQQQVTFVTDAMNATLGDVKEVMNGMTHSSEQQSNSMVNNLSEAAEKMGQFLDTTVASLSATVEHSMREITTEVNSKQSELVELQKATSKQTKELLDTFNIGLDRLEKMNEYISGTMDMFQKAQGHITGSTAHLENITADMKQSTELFKKSQTDYSSQVENMQGKTKESLQALKELMRETGELTGDYGHKFEIIKEGLGSIFAQLQNGLTQYSKTVQTSTQEYLDKYSISLTNTTDALSSTIQQQNEMVAMLSDALNSYKKK